MGIFTSFATGFLEGSVQVAKEKKEAQLEEDRISEERKDTAMGRIVDIMTSKNPNVNLATYIGQEAGFTNLELSQITNMVNTTANSENIGGVKFTGYELKGNESMFNRAVNQIKHLDGLLANDEDFRVQVEAAIKGGGRAAEDWRTYLGRLEFMASDAYDAKMKSEMGEAYIPSRYDFDIGNYANIGRLGNLFGDKSIQEVKEENNLKSAPPVQQGKTPVMFEVEILNEGTKKVTLGYDNGKMADLRELAENANVTVQEFVGSFNELRDLPTEKEIEAGVYEGLSDEEIAMKQYRMLDDVVELKRKGFYGVDLLSLSPQKRNELVQFFGEKYGVKDSTIDRYKAATVLGYLMPTPDVFNIPGKTYVFGSRNSRQSAPKMNSRKYLTEVLLIPEAELTERQEAGKYSKQTMVFLDRLYKLETTELADETGFARFAKRTIGGLGIQAEQVMGVFSSVFGGDGKAKSVAGLGKIEGFEGNFKNDKDGPTTKQSLMERAALVASELEMDLANITEADALKLTLAARMARAIDPSGRLSNQDFEVQLRRLGNALLGGPEDVKRNLEVLAQEFQREVQRNIVFARLASPGQTITPRLARTFAADRQIESILDYDIDITGGTTAGLQEDVAGENVDAGMGLPKIDVTNKRMKKREDRVYVNPQGEEYPVSMVRTEDGLVYVIQMGESYFEVDKSNLKSTKEN